MNATGWRRSRELCTTVNDKSDRLQEVEKGCQQMAMMRGLLRFQVRVPSSAFVVVGQSGGRVRAKSKLISHDWGNKSASMLSYLYPRSVSLPLLHAKLSTSAKQNIQLLSLCNFSPHSFEPRNISNRNSCRSLFTLYLVFLGQLYDIICSNSLS